MVRNGKSVEEFGDGDEVVRVAGEEGRFDSDILDKIGASKRE